jgi:site-specific recombinase XerD
MSNSKVPPATLQGVKDAIQRDETRSKRAKWEMAGAIDTLSRCVNRPPAEIDANPTALRAIYARANPRLLGISMEHFQNTKSRVNKALAHVGIAVDRRRDMPLQPEWAALLDGLANEHRVDLRKFAGWCSARGIKPAEVDQAVLERFFVFLDEQSTQHNVKERGHRARRAWNAAVAVEGSNYPSLENPFERGERSLKLTEFPASLADEVQTYLRKVTNLDLAGSRDKPLRPVTAKGHVGNLLRLGTYLVKDGVPLERFVSLRAFMDAELVARGLERMQADILSARAEAAERRPAEAQDPLKSSPQDPNSPLPIVQAAAFAVLSVAKYLGVVGQQLQHLRDLASRARVRRRGMTAKNKARLNPFKTDRAKALLLNLPDVIFKRHADLETPPTFKQARAVQNAAMVALCLELPLRVDTVAKLDLYRHVHRPIGQGLWRVSVPGHEMKTDEDVDGEFSEETSAMLTRYVDVFRPALSSQQSTALFVSREGKGKRPVTISTQLGQFIRRETGLVINAHLLRHFAATHWLDAHPTDWETPRQLLGHRSADTTRRYYAHVEKGRAQKLYQELIRTERIKLSSASKLSFDFGRRKREAQSER